MAFSPQDYDNPLNLFEIRTRQIRVRIQTLEKDLYNVKNIYSKAVILNELNNAVDDYIERKSVLNREKSEESTS